MQPNNYQPNINNQQPIYQQQPIPTPIPIQKDSKKSCPLAIAIILIILTIGGIGFGIFEMLTVNNIKNENTFANCDCQKCEEESEKNEDTTDEENDSTTDEEIRSLISSFETTITNETGYGLITTYDDLTPVYRIEDADVSTTLDKSYGLYYESSNEQAVKQVEQAMLALFENDEYTKYDYISTLGASYEFVNNDKKILCQVAIDGTIEANLSCGHTSWISDKKAELIKELKTAYDNNSEYSIDYINANPNNIQTNETTNYQYLIGSTLGSALVYYRTNSESEWQFAFAQQEEARCNQITDEINKALTGTKYGTCYNEELDESKSF